MCIYVSIFVVICKLIHKETEILNTLYFKIQITDFVLLMLMNIKGKFRKNENRAFFKIFEYSAQRVRFFENTRVLRH